MKRVLLFTGITMTFLVAMISCDRSEVEIPDAGLVFELYADQEKVDEGEIVTGVQSLYFDETRAYILRSKYVTSIVIDQPRGWDCKFYPATSEAIIKAPDMSDDEETIDLSGTVTVEVKSEKGESLTFEMQVAVRERDVDVAFVDNISVVQPFAYNNTKVFAVRVQNVADYDIVYPDGWDVTYKLGDENTISITSPAKDSGKPESGTVKITPSSSKGTVGETVEFDVAILIGDLEFDDTEKIFTELGQTLDLGFSVTNTQSISVKSLPTGWSAGTVDMEENTVTVTSPATITDPTAFGNGYLVLEVVSLSGDLVEASLPVSMDPATPGIANPTDLVAFGQAVAEGASTADYEVGGEATMLFNVDLSENDNDVFIGSKEKPFTGTFNGNNRTIVLDMETDARVAGLFHTVAATAVIKDLTVKGSILSTVSGITEGLNISAVAAISEGAKFSNITTDIQFTYNPETFTRFGGSNAGAAAGPVANIVNWGFWGSITARVNGLGEYENCTSKGRMYMQNGAMSGGGGQIGIILVDGVKLTDCVNEATLDLIFISPGNNASDCDFGGIVGHSETFETIYTDCVNKGNININNNNGTAVSNGGNLFSTGGIVGVSYGTFTRCRNEGNITESAGRFDSRRYGGIVGGVTGGTACQGSNGKSLYIIDCENSGNITQCSNFAGGIAGIVQQVKYAEIKGTKNVGNIISEKGYNAGKHTAGGGIAGQWSGNLMEDCENSGNVTGFANRWMGGLFARSVAFAGATSTEMKIVNCKNTGTLTPITDARATDTDVYKIAVGGLGSAETGVLTFENCVNTGTIDLRQGDPARIAPAKNILNIAMCNATNPPTVTMDVATEAENAKTQYIITQ